MDENTQPVPIILSEKLTRMATTRKLAIPFLLCLAALALGLPVISGIPTLGAVAVPVSQMDSAFPITTAPNTQKFPAVAYNANADKFLVVWIDLRDSSNGTHVYGQRLTGDGTLLGQEIAVALATASQHGPAVTAGTGFPDYFVAWVDLRNIGNTDSDIYGQIVGTDGSLRCEDIPISTSPGRQRSPAVGHCQSSDTYLVIWDEDEDAQPGWAFYIFGRQVSSDCLPIGEPRPISPDYPHPAFQQVNPDLVYNPHLSEYLAVFRDARDRWCGSGNNDDIYGQRLSCAGEPLLEDDLPISTQCSVPSGSNRQNLPAAAYDNQHDQYLVVWQDERNDPDAGTGNDHLDIYGQLLAGDGTPVCTPVDVNFPISTADGNQEWPDVAYSPQADAYLVVWADHRGTDANIYARLVSGCTPWAMDIIIGDAPGDQLAPAVTYNEANGHFLVVWEDYRNQANSGADIYGRIYQPPETRTQYLPIILRNYPIIWSPDAEERARAWLNQQINSFTKVTDIPGYGREGCGDRVARYKDSVVCYPAIPGDALVSFDYCNYGTPDQQIYLGRWGRGFLYDQAVGAIAWLMAGRPDKARRLLDYLSSYQNLNVPVSGAADGSFGFSFNTVGCTAYAPNNRDSFYDLNYLRSGAISWAGYAFVMYQRVTGDTRYLEAARRTADYLLTQQVTDPADRRFGLLRGGYGVYDTSNWSFIPGQIEWASTEHNVDSYFFLRDLGAVTGDTKYSTAAQQIRDGLLSELWDADKGRLDRGLGPNGETDGVDALDAASWGAIFLLAVGEEEMAHRSLDFATRTYYNSADGLWGYKPYAGIADGSNWDSVDVVWSEGSLGVAMAYLKLGLETSRSQARGIIAEMANLQDRDPAGGLMYAVYTGDELIDFPQAPSVGGTGWFAMVLRAWADPAARDAFWGIAP